MKHIYTKQELFIRKLIREELDNFNDINPYTLPDDDINEYIQKMVLDYYEKNYKNLSGFKLEESEDGDLNWISGNNMISAFFKESGIIFKIYKKDDSEDWNVVFEEKVNIEDKLDFDEIQTKYLKMLMKIIFQLPEESDFEDEY